MFATLIAGCLLVGYQEIQASNNSAAYDAANKEIVSLVKTGRITDRKHQAQLSDLFAKRFEAQYKEDIAAIFDSDKEKLEAWFAEHPEFRTKLYTAFTSRDDVKAGLEIFKEIWKKHADKLVEYDDLAIATVVVWDQPGNLNDYRSQLHWTKSELPGKQIGGLENFEYVLEQDANYGSKAAFLPWEFFVYIVDHTTPTSERQWARRYVAEAKNKKSWHQDVPYDYDMLNLMEGGTASPHLKGKEYTLQNIRECGGVCMVQADFAARVGKSVLMPASYCVGESAHRGGHAWWMFVRIDSANAKGSLKCSLLSDGRFDGKDQFYTGKVKDPQTGETMLDRDLERRLAVVGKDAAAKRHADLCMQAFAIAAEKNEFSFKDRLAYVDKVLKLSPANESAWAELASIAKTAGGDSKQRSAMLSRLNTMARTFAPYPDFLWRHFRELITVVEKPKDRNKYYNQVIGVFNNAGRPDLACAAALALASELSEKEEFMEAGHILRAAVRKFPYEGRYVPQLTSEFEKIASKYKNGPTELAELYLELLPAMFKYYKSSSSDYCVKMVEQATNYLDANGLGAYSARIKSLAASAKK